ncbi:hypothetical protein [Nocardiopsis sp. M1B1]|uniref:hypothetical protein n=1 Tax=Nocardiopsis sp. M1B1 TaxID=3450454 RepID=UPI00403A02BA
MLLNVTPLIWEKNDRNGGRQDAVGDTGIAEIMGVEADLGHATFFDTSDKYGIKTPRIRNEATYFDMRILLSRRKSPVPDALAPPPISVTEEPSP